MARRAVTEGNKPAGNGRVPIGSNLSRQVDRFFPYRLHA